MSTAHKVTPISKTKRLPAPPWINGNRKDWLTTHEIALMYGRHRATIFVWIKNGTLKEFGFDLYQDFMGRWWIKPPHGVQFASR